MMMEVYIMSDKIKIVSPDLEKSFSKQTQGMKNIVDRAIREGAIKQITNRYGNTIEVSKLPSRP